MHEDYLITDFENKRKKEEVRRDRVGMRFSPLAAQRTRPRVPERNSPYLPIYLLRT